MAPSNMGSRAAFVTYAGDVLAFCNNMRRIVASLVLSVIVWSFVAPIAMGVTGPGTPVCCRRNGKHHCASGMSGMAGASIDDPPSFRANSPVCPYRSQIGTPTGIARPQSQAVSTMQPPSASFVSGVDCLSFDPHLVSCNSQRGPPAFRL